MDFVKHSSAVFVIICSFAMFVMDAISDHIACSKIGLIMALYVERNVSLL